MSLRELARRIKVSPSFVSQLERNKANASVGTLYALVEALGVSIDRLMSGAVDLPTELPTDDPTPSASSTGGRRRARRVEQPVQRSEGRARIEFPGVIWERLTQASDPEVDFLHVEYAPGSASCSPNEMMRHRGHEYGFVLTGTLHVQVDSENYELSAGDAVTFDSLTPHRLSNRTGTPCTAVWVVVGRRDDERAHHIPNAAAARRQGPSPA
jgi:transcriptional regulator with XRE-family HTH domain